MVPGQPGEMPSLHGAILIQPWLRKKSERPQTIRKLPPPGGRYHSAAKLLPLSLLRGAYRDGITPAENASDSLQVTDMH